MAFNYVEQNLPSAIIEKLEAGAFQSLCTHLRDRSDEVQNIDIMTVSGFCRNCLAKWMVVEARKLAQASPSDSTVVKALDALGYDEAAQYVYGMHYKDWKARHAKKASGDQMESYNQSKPLWAKHDKQLLEKKGDPPQSSSSEACKMPDPASSGGKDSTPLLSNVCCQDVPEPIAKPEKKKFRELPPFKAPSPPANGVAFSLAILTVSDRASKGEYATGDLSGPAVEEAVKHVIEAMMNDKEGSNPSDQVKLTKVEKAIVSDDANAIQEKMKEWCDSTDNCFNMILTTGGTGFAPRDCTPEATRAVIDRDCPGLIPFCTAESSKLQPMAALSRGSAGIRKRTFIANLPGNPKGVHELIPILLPLSLHILSELQA